MVLGSPPPMRGKVVSERRRKVSSGITPAYAGKSYFHGSSQRKNQDHPRLCGEKIQKKVKILQFLGSPPPMRGKAAGRKTSESANGITPAYAGKRCSVYLLYVFVRDHPRLCGEKHSTFVIRSRRLGSPPPMRGKGKASAEAG